MGFRVTLYDEDIADIECLRVVTMATSFGSKIAINWLCLNDSNQAIGNGGEFEWSANRRRILQIPYTH